MAGTHTGPRCRIGRPGAERCAPRHVSWPHTRTCGASWMHSYGTTGRRSRSPGGSRLPTPGMRHSGCRTRRSIARCSYSARGALKQELIAHLRRHYPIRRSRHATAKADTRGRIPDTVSISERPASVEDRAVPGHWEGDLLCGSNNSYIVTLVERHTRYVMLAKVPSRDTQTVVNALIRQAKRLPGHLYQSLTWDRGAELTDHKRFTVATDIQVYFCDPQSPWQRGSNENTNRLLHQYFPKKTDLSVHSQARLNYVARELNERPRETLGFRTPKEKSQACVASIS